MLHRAPCFERTLKIEVKHFIHRCGNAWRRFRGVKSAG
jgi:hypothetical protein